MSTKKSQAPSDLDLMLYADGELDAAAAREVAAWVEKDPAAKSKLASLRQVGEAVRTYVELETDRAEDEIPAFGDLWSRVERRIHSNGKAEAPAAAAEAKPAAAAAAKTGIWQAIRRWFEDHRGHVLTGALSAGAAAGLMLALGSHQRNIQHAGSPGGMSSVAAPVQAAGGVVPASLRSEPPEVEDLEVYEGSGTILTIEPEGDDDSAATVIWISSDDADNTEAPI